jgi:hypothetical protein
MSSAIYPSGTPLNVSSVTTNHTVLRAVINVVDVEYREFPLYECITVSGTP